MKSEDPEVPVILQRCVVQKKTLTASFSYKALGLADVVVVDVQCDYMKNSLKDVSTGYVAMDDLEKSLEIIGDEIGRVVRWEAGADLRRLEGQPVRLRVALRDADLFALRFH